MRTMTITSHNSVANCVYNLIHLPRPDWWATDSSRWYEALGVRAPSPPRPLPPSVAVCVTADSGPLHYIRLPSKPALMKASWLQRRWQMQGGQPVMLIFVYAPQPVKIKVRERWGWGGQWRCSAGVCADLKEVRRAPERILLNAVHLLYGAVISTWVALP